MARRRLLAALTALLVAWHIDASAQEQSDDPPPAARLEIDPVRLSTHVAPGETFMGIRLLGTVRIRAQRGGAGGIRVLHSLSGLGWDDDEGILYAISDRSELHRLRPIFVAGRLVDLEWLGKRPLIDQHGRPLQGREADSEGLVVRNGRNRQRGDSRLLVSFERQPRIVEFRPDGSWQANHALPREFSDPADYASSNRMLESLAFSPEHGALSAAERPRPGDPFATVALFGIRDRGQAQARRWTAPYRLSDTPSSGLVAMEWLPDGSLLTLERGWGVFGLPIVITIRRTAPLPLHSPDTLSVRSIAVLSTSNGWRVDNFEGLARHQGMKFFMVSDDNAKYYQRTLLAYFEVLPEDQVEDLGTVPEFDALHKGE